VRYADYLPVLGEPDSRADRRERVHRTL